MYTPRQELILRWPKGRLEPPNLPRPFSNLMANKNGKTKRDHSRKPRVTNSTNFPRVRRLPTRVQAASELWLDMFLRNIDTLLATRPEHMGVDDARVLESGTIAIAERMADLALDTFQKRWPNAEL